MKIILEKIFKGLDKTDQRNFNQESLVTMSKENLGESKNSMVFDFTFDGNGDYTYAGSEYGFGKDVSVRGKITVPEDGIYSVKIVSSDGGGGQWNNVKANEEVSCVINTSFLHKTTITVSIHSNKRNCNGHAFIDYSV